MIKSKYIKKVFYTSIAILIGISFIPTTTIESYGASHVTKLKRLRPTYKRTILLAKGERTNFRIKSSPSNLSSKEYKTRYSSKNFKIAKISKQGSCLPKKTGKTTITCRNLKSGARVSWNIRVVNKLKTMNRVSPTAEKNYTQTDLRTTYSVFKTPAEKYGRDIIFSSSNPSVLKISRRGSARAISNGTSTITARNYKKGSITSWKVTVDLNNGAAKVEALIKDLPSPYKLKVGDQFAVGRTIKEYNKLSAKNKDDVSLNLRKKLKDISDMMQIVSSRQIEIRKIESINNNSIDLLIKPSEQLMTNVMVTVRDSNNKNVAVKPTLVQKGTDKLTIYFLYPVSTYELHGLWTVDAHAYDFDAKKNIKAFIDARTTDQIITALYNLSIYNVIDSNNFGYLRKKNALTNLEKNNLNTEDIQKLVDDVNRESTTQEEKLYAVKELYHACIDSDVEKTAKALNNIAFQRVNFSWTNDYLNALNSFPAIHENTPFDNVQKTIDKVNLNKINKLINENIKINNVTPSDMDYLIENIEKYIEKTDKGVIVDNSVRANYEIIKILSTVSNIAYANSSYEVDEYMPKLIEITKSQTPGTEYSFEKENFIPENSYFYYKGAGETAGLIGRAMDEKNTPLKLSNMMKKINESVTTDQIKSVTNAKTADELLKALSKFNGLRKDSVIKANKDYYWTKENEAFKSLTKLSEVQKVVDIANNKAARVSQIDALNETAKIQNLSQAFESVAKSMDIISENIMDETSPEEAVFVRYRNFEDKDYVNRKLYINHIRNKEPITIETLKEFMTTTMDERDSILTSVNSISVNTSNEDILKILESMNSELYYTLKYEKKSEEELKEKYEALAKKFRDGLCNYNIGKLKGNVKTLNQLKDTIGIY